MVDDDVLTHLQSLHIPTCREDAVSRIMMAAKQSPRKMLPGVKLLRQLRAAAYVPSMRYVLMASIVGFFILIGLIFESSPMPISDEQIAAAQADDDSIMAQSDLLKDINILDDEDWDDEFLSDDSQSGTL